MTVVTSPEFMLNYLRKMPAAEANAVLARLTRDELIAVLRYLLEHNQSIAA
jgi:hypothetical protein